MPQPPDLTEFVVSMRNRREQAFAELQAQVHSVDPRYLLSHLGAYFVPHREGSDPELDPDHAGQVEAELVQAIALSNRSPILGSTPINGPVAAAIASRAKEVMFLGHFGNMANSSGSAASPVQAGIRSFTAGVRNWGYPRRAFELVRDLFAPLDDEIEERVGVRIGGVLELFEWMIHEVENRLNEHSSRLSSITRKKGKEGMLRALEAGFPGLVSVAPEYVEEARKSSPAKCRNIIWGLTEALLPTIFTFSFDQLAVQASGDRNGLHSILGALSYPWGALADVDPQTFLITNPIQLRPLIECSNHEYFVPVVGVLGHSPLELVESLVPADFGARVEARRATFLETETSRVVRMAFPSAEVHTNNSYSVSSESGTQVCENDILGVLAETVLIVECKSGRFTPPARRGAEARLEREIEELVVAPGDQVNRLRHELESKARFVLTDGEGESFAVERERTKRYIGLAVTLDSSMGLMRSVRELERLGTIKRAPDPIALSIPLMDLEVVLDALKSEGERIHYLIRRLEWEESGGYLGDELDLLARYLGSALNERPADGVTWILAGFSKLLDAYYERPVEEREQSAAPRLQVPGWWGRVVQQFLADQGPGGIEAALVLLSVEFLALRVLEERVRRRINQIRQGRVKTYPSVFHRECVLGGETSGVVIIVQHPDHVHEKLDQEVLRGVLVSRAWASCVAVSCSDIDARPYDRVIFARR